MFDFLRKDDYSKEAAEIAKKYGDKELTLFKFPTHDDQYGEGQVYAILPFNSRIDAYEKIFDVDSYYELTFWSEKSAATKKEAEAKLRMIKRILPYELPVYSSEIGWEQFNRIYIARHVAKRIERMFTETYNDTIESCWSVTEGDESTPDDLIFIVFGKGVPFKAGTNYDIAWHERWNNTSHEDAIKQMEMILKHCSCTDKTIHETEMTYEQAFEHYND